MLLLHISDIHFRAPNCVDPHLDPNRPYRTRLLRDVRDRARDLGPVKAILIGGDIAYQGATAEYQAAMNWIQDLVSVAGCSMERVFVVPGNHDIDRTIIASSPAVRNTQAAIVRASSERREQEFCAQIRDGDTGRSLVAPLAAYNDFAKNFNCQSCQSFSWPGTRRRCRLFFQSGTRTANVRWRSGEPGGIFAGAWSPATATSRPTRRTVDCTW